MLGVLIVIAILVQFRNIAGAIDHSLALAFYGILLTGSGFLLVRMWRKRLEPNQVHRPPSQIDVLPPRWRRWVLDEDQPPRNSS
jgi:hypothetical protein